MKFMLQYEGLKTMRELRLEQIASEGVSAKEVKSIHELFNPEEKTQPDGTPLTMIDLLYDRRYEEREYDSEYYDEDHYYSEKGDGTEESEQESDPSEKSEYDDEEEKKE